jgi:primosomal replication protein N
MGKGGGGQSATQTQIQDVPEWAKPSYQRLLSATEGQIFDITKGPEGQEQIGLKPYQAYEGQRLAETPQDIRGSQEMIRGIAGTPIAGMNEAMGATRRAITGLEGAAQYRTGEFTPFGEFQQYDFRGPFQFSEYGFRPDYQFQQFQYQQPETFTGGAVQQYMSPYMQSAVEQQQRQAQLEFERQGAGRAAQAVQAGAFGGSRQAVQEALAEEALARQMGDIQARGSQAAFEQAAQQFGLDRAARMQVEQQRAAEAARVQQAAAAEQARVDQARYTELANRESAQAAEFARAGNAEAAEAARVQAARYEDLARRQAAIEQSRQFGAGQALAGYQALASTASGLAGLGERQRAADIQGAQLLEAQGLGEMARGQAGLDVAYQDFLRQQGYPMEQLGQFSTMLRGLPVAPAGTATTYQPTPSAGQQALGTGISLLGLYRGLQ